MAITDLTGTTWVINDTITFSSSLGLSNITSFNFTSNNTSFYGFYFDVNADGDNSLGYKTNQEYSADDIYNSSGHIISGKEAYKTITITGGTDATNSALISWLQANATKQSSISFKHFFHNSPIGSGTIRFRPYTVSEPLPQLSTVSNVSVDGTTVSWDEVENATSYEILADGTSIGEVNN